MTRGALLMVLLVALVVSGCTGTSSPEKLSSASRSGALCTRVLEAHHAHIGDDLTYAWGNFSYCDHNQGAMFEASCGPAGPFMMLITNERGEQRVLDENGTRTTATNGGPFCGWGFPFERAAIAPVDEHSWWTWNFTWDHTWDGHPAPRGVYRIRIGSDGVGSNGDGGMQAWVVTTEFNDTVIPRILTGTVSP